MHRDSVFSAQFDGIGHYQGSGAARRRFARDRLSDGWWVTRRIAHGRRKISGCQWFGMLLVGGAGAVARFRIDQFITARAGGSFPSGTRGRPQWRGHSRPDRPPAWGTSVSEPTDPAITGRPRIATTGHWPYQYVPSKLSRMACCASGGSVCRISRTRARCRSTAFRCG